MCIYIYIERERERYTHMNFKESRHPAIQTSISQAYMLRPAEQLDSPKLHNALPSWLGLTPGAKSRSLRPEGRVETGDLARSCGFLFQRRNEQTQGFARSLVFHFIVEISIRNGLPGSA